MKTITLKWKQYAQVSERIKAVHIDNKNVSIKTELNWIWDKGALSVQAIITTDKGEYTGHSFWTWTKEKGVEKLESVAVGRALAFAGYLADWEIASYEEVEDFINNK